MSERRGANSLNDILKLSLKLSDQEMTNYNDIEMEEERKAWLQAAITTSLENDDTRKMELYTTLLLKYVEKLGTLSELEISDLINVFEALNFLVEGFDMNIAFMNLGGLKATLAFLESEHACLQWNSADLIANCVQNAEKCQNLVIEEGGLRILVGLLQRSIDDIVRIKCLYAISSLVGNNINGVKAFVELGGLKVISQFFASDVNKLQLKSTFLLQKILSSEFAVSINTAELIPFLADALVTRHGENHISIINIISEILKNNNQAIELFCSLNLTDFLQKQIIELDEDGQADDAEAYKTLLTICG